jgi:hypothetical protein
MNFSSVNFNNKNNENIINGLKYNKFGGQFHPLRK